MVQRGEAWLKTATPEQIVAAQNGGELATYLGGLTAEQQLQERVVAASADRVLEAAYGLGVGQLRSNAARSSNWFEAMRRRMDAAQLEKLAWVESATPAEVYAAEQAGDLSHLTGKDVSDEQARLEAVAASVTAAMSGGTDAC